MLCLVVLLTSRVPAWPSFSTKLDSKENLLLQSCWKFCGFLDMLYQNLHISLNGKREDILIDIKLLAKVVRSINMETGSLDFCNTLYDNFRITEYYLTM